MDFIKEEKIISLKELIYSICIKWRIIIGLSVLSAVFVGIINVVGAIKYAKVLGEKQVLILLFKKVFVVAVITFILCVVIYVCKYMFSNKLKSMRDFQLSTNIRILGVIPNKNINNNWKLDVMLKKYSGIKVRYADIADLVKRIINIINNDICINGGDYTTKVAVVSSYSENETKELVNMLEQNKINDKFIVLDAGDINSSSDSIKKVVSADYVVLVERQNKSNYVEIDFTCKQLYLLNKKILGAVILDVDAI